MDQHTQWNGDAAAYALGALEPAEVERFEEHVRGCAACQAELSEMRSAVEVLPLAAAQVEAPKRLRQAVLAEVRPANEQQSRWPRRLGLPAAIGLAPGRVAVGLGAIAVAFALGAVAFGGNGSSSRPATTVYRGRVTFAHGAASVRVSGGTPELVVEHMPAPPKGKVYEVWVARRARPIATSALFDVNAKGSATVVVPHALRGISAVMVTAEPPGGSPRPTSTPVIDVPVRS